jgi:hypothetical protein
MMSAPLAFAIALGLGVAMSDRAVAADAAVGSAQSYAFTYQGYLEQNGAPANGNYDLVFSLWDAQSGGTQYGASITEAGWPVADGRFAVDLAWIGAFDGTQRWLEVQVDGTTLPRQPVGTAPVAQYA